MLAVLITGYAGYTTTSVVMVTEMFYSVACAIEIRLRRRANTSPSMDHYDLRGEWGYVLFGAGVLSLTIGLKHLLVLTGGDMAQVNNPVLLLLASLVTVPIVWTRLKLTTNLRDPLHTEDKVEQFAGLVQAWTAVAMGLIALFLENAYGVRCLDVFISISVGLWMLWRGLWTITD